MAPLIPKNEGAYELTEVAVDRKKTSQVTQLPSFLTDHKVKIYA